MQYHGVNGVSVTIQKELAFYKYVTTSREWLVLCLQFIEALRYLHEDIKLLHNDLKADNILITKPSNSCPIDLLYSYQIVLIDFGKACTLENGKKYNLTKDEKVLYYTFCSHLAPELAEGISKQATFSDTFSLGKVIKQICAKGVSKRLQIFSPSWRAMHQNVCQKILNQGQLLFIWLV